MLSQVVEPGQEARKHALSSHRLLKGVHDSIKELPRGSTADTIFLGHLKSKGSSEVK